MEFKEIVEKRYATKQFNGEQLSQEKVDALLELIRMAASSFGLQPFKVKVITDSETKEKLLPHSFNQPQVTSCSHLLVFCANTNVTDHIDKYEKMLIDGGMPEDKAKEYTGMMRGSDASRDEAARLSWAQRQTYIALGNALNGAKSLGFDSCPMEGFDPEKYKEILNLPEDLTPTALVPIGIAADVARPKMRFPKEELFF